MRKTASRFMPPVAVRPPLRWPARCFLAVMAVAFMAVFWTHPVAVGGSLLALGSLVAVLSRREALRLARMAQGRAGESICQFARAIDCRRVDTWVVRAVYEELQRSLSAAVAVPLRLTDTLQSDLRLDADDLDDLFADMAQRARRSLADTSANPLFGKVITVGDLVEFLQAQPRLPTGS
ncbi:hypothetical protein J2W88_000651 [Acidovorax delafieldii]|uniref:Uncharacterized protein n=1 Tax=Acidovorax delafieldii TaxID=47920 RepID=A0AAJ2F2R5_ACIDE|nr:hypothetical protein [Acidovorax delafieldii]MDR6765393.1 hypothetical protein [Acidovorax delafieldii]MDR6835831.1 hypothetical protein [Acidovorax delafieldii]MDR7365199.1 hypothetical protein [Acidovorax delafieldii]